MNKISHNTVDFENFIFRSFANHSQKTNVAVEAETLQFLLDHAISICSRKERRIFHFPCNDVLSVFIRTLFIYTINEENFLVKTLRKVG